MKTAAIIPARYSSGRLKGKPLMDIWGRPMIWWVYNNVRKSRKIDQVYAATDNDEIYAVCRKYGLNCIMTSPDAETSTLRVYEAARSIDADLYICVNGDEPLIPADTIEKIIPESAEGFFAGNLMTKIKTAAEAVDSSNIKVAVNKEGYAVFMSRSLIPYPKDRLLFDYYKHLGVLAYTMEALEFFKNTPKGICEAIEDINELRFIENGKKLKMTEVECGSLSVDTQKDLEYVRQVIGEMLEGEALRV